VAQQIAQTLAVADSHYRQGRMGEAERLCRSVLAKRPGHFVALNLLGHLAGASGHMQQAAAYFHQATTANPKSHIGHVNEGAMLASLGRHTEALACFDRAAKLEPKNPRIATNRGSALAVLGRPLEALAEFDRAIALDPTGIEAYTNKAGVLQSLLRHAEAIDALDRAMDIKPDDASLHIVRALVLEEMGRSEEALADSETALRLDPNNDRSHLAHAAALHGLHRPEEALGSFDRALAIAPNNVRLIAGRATLLYELDRFEEALAACALAKGLAPDDAEALCTESAIRLAVGDFEGGWPAYEWRWRRFDRASSRPEIDQPLWLGETDLTGKRILLHAEQGLGDTLQFCRYAPLVAQKAMVVLEVQQPLVRLLGSLGGVARIIGKGDPLPDVDFHCPLMSLPLAFGTRLENIPDEIPYLRPDPARVTAWQQRLAGLPGRHVGLVWAGSPALGGNRGSDLDRRRSITLDHLAGLREVPGIRLVSLQKGPPAVQTRSPPAGLDVTDWTDELTDFADTAALVAALDLIISVDTAVAHLAGALGKPVWILHRFDACWRWLRGREDSPWYPTARLFRQSTPADWSAPIRALIEALREAGSASVA
jgi:tetratricopeptide (TPR) repeat protein